MDETTIARFWSKVNKNSPVHPVLNTECWLWASSTRDAYGQFRLNNKMELAHRVSWFIKHGKWPNPCALHHCDNRPCIRPEHLFEGTRGYNNADARAKGRQVYPSGEQHGRVKLSSAAVNELRQRSKIKGMTQRQLAIEFEIDHTHVGRILRGVNRISG